MADENVGKAELQAKEDTATKSGECPECGVGTMGHDSDLGEYVCHNCGLVVSDKEMARGPEWRAFDGEQRAKRGRTGAPYTPTIHEGLTTVIGPRRTGKALTYEQRGRDWSLRKWQSRIRVSDAQERNLAIALSDLGRYAKALNLPRSVYETASVNYRRTLKKNLVKGRSVDTVVLASIYMACRQTETPRSLEEVAAVSETGVSKKDIARTYRQMYWDVVTYDVKPTAYTQFGTRLSNLLNLSSRTEANIIKILDAAYEAGLKGGRSPKGLAGAAAYIACTLGDERKTQKEIAEIAGVTEVTVRNRYKEIKERLGPFIDSLFELS